MLSLVMPVSVGAHGVHLVCCETATALKHSEATQEWLEHGDLDTSVAYMA